MKTLLASCLLLASTLSTRAQIIGRPIKTYTTRMGTVLHVGDTIKFALGQREDGSFKYESIPVQAFHSNETSLPSSWGQRTAVITSLREVSHKTGWIPSVIFKSGGLHASLNPDLAEESGEIRTPNNKTKATPANSGVADELLKLKSLLDSGVLTQAEFETAKKKLLAR